MTCASCAMRIEKKLNKLEGVHRDRQLRHREGPGHTSPTASTPQTLIAEVEKAGYTAALPAPPEHQRRRGRRSGRTPSWPRCGNRLIGSRRARRAGDRDGDGPGLQFTYWQWASLTLAAPVVLWAAWPFHQAAWTNLRHGAATMDTLVSLGTLPRSPGRCTRCSSAPPASPGMTHPFELTVGPSDGAANIYLEVAAGVTMFVLAGRYFEKRSKRQAGAALRALLELGAKDVAVLRDGVETRIPIDELAVGDEFVVRPGEKIATDGVVVAGTSARSTPPC